MYTVHECAVQLFISAVQLYSVHCCTVAVRTGPVAPQTLQCREQCAGSSGSRGGREEALASWHRAGQGEAGRGK